MSQSVFIKALNETLEFPDDASPDQIKSGVDNYLQSRRTQPSGESSFFAGDTQPAKRAALQSMREQPEETFSSQYWPEVVRGGAREIQGASSVVSGALKAAGRTAEAIDRRLPSFLQRGSDTSPFTKGGQWIERQVEKLPGTEDQDFWSSTQRGIGQLVPAVATGVAGRALGLGATATRLIAGGSMAGAEFDDAFEASRQKGDSPDKAFAKAAIYSAIATGIEQLGGAGRIMSKIAKDAKTLSALGISKEIASNFASGYGEEFAQRVAQDMIVNGPPEDKAAALQYLKNAHEEGLVGAVVQGPTSTAIEVGKAHIEGGPKDAERRRKLSQDYWSKNDTEYNQYSGEEFPAAQEAKTPAVQASKPPSIAHKILQARGVDNDVANAIAETIGPKLADETLEDYRQRLFNAHDNAGFVVMKEARLPYMSLEVIKQAAEREGLSADDVQKTVEAAKRANEAALNAIREKNNRILSNRWVRVGEGVATTAEDIRKEGQPAPLALPQKATVNPKISPLGGRSESPGTAKQLSIDLSSSDQSQLDKASQMLRFGVGSVQVVDPNGDPVDTNALKASLDRQRRLSRSNAAPLIEKSDIIGLLQAAQQFGAGVVNAAIQLSNGFSPSAELTDAAGNAIDTKTLIDGIREKNRLAQLGKGEAHSVFQILKLISQNANPIQKRVEVARGQQAAAATQVPEGQPGQVQPAAGVQSEAATPAKVETQKATPAATQVIRPAATTAEVLGQTPTPSPAPSTENLAKTSNAPDLVTNQTPPAAPSPSGAATTTTVASKSQEVKESPRPIESENPLTQAISDYEIDQRRLLKFKNKPANKVLELLVPKNLANFLFKTKGYTSWSQWNYQDLLDWRDTYLEDESRIKQGKTALKQSVKNQYLTFIENFLKWQDKVADSPNDNAIKRAKNALDRTLVREKQQMGGKQDFISDEDIEKLMPPTERENPYSLRIRAAMEIYYATGLRANDVAALKKSQFDNSDPNRPWLRNVDINKQNLIGDVPLTQSAAYWLKKYLDTPKPDFVENEYIFTGKPTDKTSSDPKNWHIKGDAIRNDMQKRADALGLKLVGGQRLLLHSFRKSVIQHLSEMGMSEQDINRIVPHKDKTVTAKHYLSREKGWEDNFGRKPSQLPHNVAFLQRQSEAQKKTEPGVATAPAQPQVSTEPPPVTEPASAMARMAAKLDEKIKSQSSKVGASYLLGLDRSAYIAALVIARDILRIADTINQKAGKILKPEAVAFAEAVRAGVDRIVSDLMALRQRNERLTGTKRQPVTEAEVRQIEESFRNDLRTEISGAFPNIPEAQQAALDDQQEAVDLAGSAKSTSTLVNATPEQQAEMEQVANSANTNPADIETERQFQEQMEGPPNVTSIFGVNQNALGVARVNTEAGRAKALAMITEAGLNGILRLNPQTGFFSVVEPEPGAKRFYDDEVRRFMDILTRELGTVHSRTETEIGDYLGVALNTAMELANDTNPYVTEATRMELAGLAQGERSWRGAMLAALRGLERGVVWMSKNAPLLLTKIMGSSTGYGDSVRGLVATVVRDFRNFFTEEEISRMGVTFANEKNENGQTLREIIERVIAVRRLSSGNQIFKRVQRIFTEPRDPNINRLQQSAANRELAQKLVNDMIKAGFSSKERIPQGLSAWEQIAFMVNPNNAIQFRDMLENAVEAAKKEAALKAEGVKVTQDLSAVPEEFKVDDDGVPYENPREAAQAYLKALDENWDNEDWGMWEKLDKDAMIQAGLALPEFAHWDLPITTLLNYNPVTVDLIRKAIKQDLKGTRFPSNKPQTEDTRTENINEWALLNKEQLAAKLAEYEALAIKKLEEDGQAMPETVDRVKRDVMREVASQVELARKAVRDRYLAETAETKTNEERQKLRDEWIQKLRNAGLFLEDVLNDNATREEREKAIESISTKPLFRRYAPSVNKMINEILRLPSYKRQQAIEQFGRDLANKFLIDESSAPQEFAAAKAIFSRVYTAQWDRLARKAFNSALKRLIPQIKEYKDNEETALWRKVQNLINASTATDASHLFEEFSSLNILSVIAEDRGFTKPTEEDFRKLKEWGEKMEKLQEVDPETIRTIREQYKNDPALMEMKIAEAKVARMAATWKDQFEYKKRIEVLWNKLVKPLGITSISKFRNLTEAAVVAAAANMLFTPGFVFRQIADVLPASMLHWFTDSIAWAVDQYHLDKAAGRPTDFMSTVLGNLWNNGSAYLKSHKATLTAARATLKTGATDLRNIERMLTGVDPFEELLRRANEYRKSDNPAKRAAALGMTMLAFIRYSYRVAAATDVLQGTPLEAQLQRKMAIQFLRSNGMDRVAAEAQWQKIVEAVREKSGWALQEARRINEMIYRDKLVDRPASEVEIKDAANKIIRGLIYEEMAKLQMPRDDFIARARAEKNAWGWNERAGGIGGVIAKSINATRRGMVQVGIPVPGTNFGNAIGLMMNRMLSFTPMAATNWGQQLFFGVDPRAISRKSESQQADPFYRFHEQRIERKVEAYTGTAVGFALFAAIMSGAMVHRRKWPKDPNERAMWEANNMRPGQLDIPLGNGYVQRISTSNGPLALFSPTISAASALRDLLDDREKKQAKLDEEADRRGLPRTKLPPMTFSELIGVPAAAAWAAIGGGRTASGLVGSLTNYGDFNLAKAVSSQVGPLIPGVPAARELSRLFGNRVDTRLAGFFDFLVPLPTSGAAQVNMLGDKVGSSSDVQRILQTLTGGNVPFPVKGKPSESDHAYKVLFGSEFQPPPVDPSKAYVFSDGYRTMNDRELGYYSRIRGRYLKEGLEILPEDAPKSAVAEVYKAANDRALSEVGASRAPSASYSRPGNASGSALAAAGATLRRGASRSPFRTSKTRGRAVILPTRRPLLRRVSAKVTPRAGIRRLRPLRLRVYA